MSGSPKEPPDSAAGTATATRTIEGSRAGAVDGPAVAPGELRVVPFENYALGQEHARGGLGRILKARDLRLDRDVAVKELLRGGAAAARRFGREARLTARLQHPAIIPVHETGRWPSGEPFYTMKLVTGRTLKEIVDERPRLEDRLALLLNVIAVAEAIAYAHSQSIVHRDLKPSNVLVGAFGETVVVDWGLAKDLKDADDDAALDAGPYRTEAADGLTMAGTVLGTPAYMPPEQATGKPADERADVYALGAMLYHVLAGAAPYQGLTSADILDRVIAAPPAPLDELRPGVPRDLITIVTKAMARDPAARYPSAAELAADLRRFQTGQLVTAHRYSRTALVSRWVRLRRGYVAIGALSVAVLAAIGITSLQRVVRARELADQRRQDAEVARDREEGARQEAETRANELMLVQARQLMLAGDPLRALVFLDEAYRGGARGATIQYLLARATRELDRPITSLDEPAAPVRTVAFSPDGGRVVAGSEDGLARVWDAGTGTRLTTLTGHTGPLTFVTFTADGQRVLTASNDGTARVWDAPSGRALFVLQHKARVETIAESPDRTRLLTASGDRTAVLWNAATGARITTFSHDWQVREAVFSPDGTRLATASTDGTGRVWDVASGRELARLSGHTDVVVAIAFSPDGTRLATGSWDTTARLWEAASGRLLATLTSHVREVRSVAWSPDGSRVITASEDGTARVWDAQRGGQLRSLEHTGFVSVARFSPDGARIATASGDKSVKLWESSGRLVATLQHLDTVYTLAFDPTGARLVSASNDGLLKVWNAKQSEALVTLARPARPARHNGLLYGRFSADGARALTIDEGGQVLTWDATTAQQLGQLDPADLAAWTVAPELPRMAAFEKSVVGADVTSNGTHIIIEKEGAVLRRSDGAEVHLVHRDPEVAALSVDGALAVTGGKDGTVRLWDAHGHMQALVVGHKLGVTAAAFDRRGERLVTASADSTAKVWDVRTGRLLVSFDGHNDDLTATAFSPDGSLVATGNWDGTGRIWDAGSGDVLGILGLHTSAVSWVAFSPDGTRLLTASMDGSARVWDVSLETRSPAEIEALVRCRVPFQLVDGKRLLPVVPQSCR